MAPNSLLVLMCR